MSYKIIISASELKKIKAIMPNYPEFITVTLYNKEDSVIHKFHRSTNNQELNAILTEIAYGRYETYKYLANDWKTEVLNNRGDVELTILTLDGEIVRVPMFVSHK